MEKNTLKPQWSWKTVFASVIPLLGVVFFLFLSNRPYPGPVCRNPSSTLGFGIGQTCQSDLDLIFDPTQARQSALDLLENEFESIETDYWSTNRLFPVLKSAVEEKNNWTHFRLQDNKRKTKVVWLQQRDLKEMNEVLWNLSGTEYHLALLDLELTHVLESASDTTRVIHRNYKDRILETTLSDEDFEKKILRPLQEKIVEVFLKARYGQKGPLDEQKTFWSNWMREKLTWTYADDLVPAHLKLKGIDPLNFKEWREITIKIQNDLTSQFPSEKFLEILDEIRRTRGKVDEIQKIGLKFDLSKKTMEQFATLVERLQVLDFLPMDDKISAWNYEAFKDFFKDPVLVKSLANQSKTNFEDSWLLQRQIFFMKFIKKGKYLVALDRRNFGRRALAVRSEWLVSGQSPENMPYIYTQLTADLMDEYEGLLRNVRNIFHNSPDVFLYRSGDDALLSIPDATPEQLQDLTKLLRSVERQFYSFLEPRDPTLDASKSAAKAVFSAREQLFKQN